MKKRDINRSTLSDIDGPFRLIQADIADLRFLGKSATHPKYCLLAVDVFSSKIYTYPMRQRDLLTKKLKMFYEDIQAKKQRKQNVLAGRQRLEVEKYLLQNKKFAS